MRTNDRVRFAPAWLVLPVALVGVLVTAWGCSTAPGPGPTAPASGPSAETPSAPAILAVESGPNVMIDPKLFQDLAWRSVGPHRGGRVTAVAGVRIQPSLFYMGTVGGGVWKTENYGISWQPITDGQISTGSIGSIAVAESDSNIIYVGTGSKGIRSNVILGRGAYKSSDAGRTWAFIGLKDAGQIGVVKIHPKDPNTVYAAALGNPFAPNPERGVFRTTDGGTTWKKVLFINDRTGAASLAMNPANPKEIYAAAWRGERKGWTIISGGPATEGGIYKTIDGGDTWTHLSNGLPQKLIGKIALDLSPTNPSRVYALVEAPGAEGGVYRSDDSGATFQQTSSDPDLVRRPFYYIYINADPKNADVVYVNNETFYKSVDAGKTWTSIETPHGDNHGMWINPDNPNLFIQCNDGGTNVTQDGGKSWSSIMNQPTAEFYMVDTDEQFPYRIYGPQQDNSTVVVSSLPPYSWPLSDPTQAWWQASGCESGQIRPTPDGKLIYGDCKGEFGRYDTATGQEQMYWIYPQQRYGLNPKDMKFRFVRQAPLEVDPLNPTIVYHGSQYLHKTTDGGITWQTISPDLTANEPDKQMASGEPITRDVTGEEVYSALYAIRASRTEPGVIWTGSNDGPVWVTRNGGKTWKNVTPKDLPPGGRVHTIEDSPHRKGSAYVSVYRLYFGDFKPYLYMTNDYGETWTLLTDGANGIPGDHPMHVVREDPQVEGLLYAGTWYAAFVSFDNGKHWQSLQRNLPATPVTDIKVHKDDLVISTMGRSFWIMDDIAPLRQLAKGFVKTAAAKGAVAPFDSAASAFLFKPADTYRMQYNATVGQPGWPTYPPPGARIDYALKGEASSEVKLEILDATGKVIRTYSSEAKAEAGGRRSRRGAGGAIAPPKKAGMTRFMWDLQYPGVWSAASPAGGGGGPLVPPGTYTVRLTAEGTTLNEPLVVKMDPRVAKAGITQADLVEQASFLLKVRDASSEAERLADRVRQALESKTGDQAAVQALYDQLVNKGGSYPENMMIQQIANVSRMAGAADGKVGKSAYERFTDVMKEFAALKAEGDKILPPQK